MAAMQRQVSSHDIHGWFDGIRRELTTLARIRGSRGSYLFDAGSELRQRLSARPPFFCFDFDGTLAPIVEHPAMAYPTGEVGRLLLELRRLAPVVVVSGRSLHDLRRRCGIAGVWYAGNHGAEIWNGTEAFNHAGAAATAPRLQALLAELHEMAVDIPGILIEDKGVTASVHYRQVPPQAVAGLRQRFEGIVSRYDGVFRVTSGKKVFDIRPADAWNKGDALAWLAAGPYAGMMPVYLGDDTTDVDAFRAVGPAGISISVGGFYPTDYYLATQEEVPRLLQFLLSLLDAGQVVKETPAPA